MTVDTKSITLILGSVLMIALGQVFWKLGTNQTGTGATFIKTISNIWFILGCLMLLGSSWVWILALQRVDLSYAFPFQALAYALIFIFSIFLFKEPVTTMKVIGTILIIAGVIVVSKG
ncbi:MAG: hypothetical protein A2231_12065 [Candidatus Firestonebacteria bacterium RIFOXYA2_FULL_40_8]|nr:MAG: hypothetical protein A2231_12065 [Candidatus Firestonebacteria bacterium RIFOXYA2_FULL_40_8]